MMAALFAARAGAAVTVLETTRQGGKKIVVSGGGRCNVLPSAVDARRFVTASSPRTLARILRAWPQPAQQRFFEHELGLPLALEPGTGKLFPASGRAADVRQALLGAAQAAGARFQMRCRVTRLEPEAHGWAAYLDGHAEALRADAVVLATGGLSVPATGSEGFGLREAARLGHTVHPTYPALTPLTAVPAPHAALAGVSLAARLRAGAGREAAVACGGFLFTHRGYSGPAVLDVSHVAVRARAAGAAPDVRVQWAGRDAAVWEEALRADGPGLVATTLRAHLPARLADALLAEAGLPPARTRAELRRDERRTLVRLLADYPLTTTGDEGYKKAEVTGGGVALGEVDPRTMESRPRPGLFLCGELLDAFGPIGGYNFFWAWSTGRAAGLGAARAT